MTSTNTVTSSLAHSSVGTTMRQSKSKNKITINLSRTQKQQQQQSRKQSEVQDECDLNNELQKLFDISQRCQAYFDKYIQQHQHEVDYTQSMFNELFQFLESTFKSLLQSIEIKKKELMNSVDDKKVQFLTVKNLQFEHLSKKLNNVKIIQSQCKELKRYNEENLSIFAVALNEFYEKIQQIEKVNYRQNIRESINFLHRLIQDQSSSGFLHDNDHDRLFDPTDTPVSISFNNDQLFSVRDRNVDKWDQCRILVEFQQKKREERIKEYDIVRIMAI